MHTGRHDRFYAMVEDETALIITHRFTTAKRADIIHVMHEGKVIESGSHDDLLAQEGHYAASWRAQVESGQYAVTDPFDGNGVDADPHSTPTDSSGHTYSRGE